MYTKHLEQSTNSTQIEMEHLPPPTDFIDIPNYTFSVTLLSDSSYTGLHNITYHKYCVLLLSYYDTLTCT